MAFTTYKGYYVFHLFPYWEIELDSQKTLRDYYNAGRYLGYSYSEVLKDHPVFSASFVYQRRDLDKIKEIDDLFDDRLGRKGLLWFPTWNFDFKITQAIGINDTTLQIANMEFSTFYPFTNTIGKYIFIYKNDSIWFAKKIISAPSSTSIIIESALGTALALSDIKNACFLIFGRFDIDEIEWEFPVKDAGRTTLHFIEVPHEYPT